MTRPPAIDRQSRPNAIKREQPAPPGNFTGWRTVYCAKFGCGKKLTPTQALYNDRCGEHQTLTKPDASKTGKL